jgi:hypothetical protein
VIDGRRAGRAERGGDEQTGQRERTYSKRTVEGAVILRSIGIFTALTPKAATGPVPMVV